MTFCFIQAVERGQASTYGSVLNSMRTAIRNTGSSGDIGLGGGVVTSLITMLLTGGSAGGGLRQVCNFMLSYIFRLLLTFPKVAT